MRLAIAALALLLFLPTLPASGASADTREWWVYIDYQMDVRGTLLAHDPGDGDLFPELTAYRQFYKSANESGLYAVTSDGSPADLDWPDQTGHRVRSFVSWDTQVSKTQSSRTDLACDDEEDLHGPILLVDLSYRNDVVHGIVQPVPARQVTCPQTTSITDEAGTRTRTDVAYMPGSLEHAEAVPGPILLNGAANHWGAGEIQSEDQFRFDAAVNRTTDLRSSESAPTGERGSSTVSRYCPSSGWWQGQNSRGTRTGRCTWTGHLHVFIEPSPCDRLRDEFDRRFDEFRAEVNVPFETYPPAVLQAWEEHMRPLFDRLLGVERQAILLGCDLPREAEAMDLILKTFDKRRDAWYDLLSNGAEKRWVPSWLSAERDAQLLGLEAGPTPAPYQVTTSPEGTVSVSAYSPVRIDAYGFDGKHVGWNVAANASEVQVPGANYTGQPGSPQTLTLPGGTWRVAITELADAPYLLNASWTAPGLDGTEEMLAFGTKGRTTTTYYVVEPDANGTWTAHTAPFLRQSTASFTPGFARPLASAPPPDVKPSALFALTAGAASTSGATSGNGESGTTNATPAKPAPSTPIALAVVALALVAVALRRRP